MQPLKNCIGPTIRIGQEILDFSKAVLAIPAAKKDLFTLFRVSKDRIGT